MRHVQAYDRGACHNWLMTLRSPRLARRFAAPLLLLPASALLLAGCALLGTYEGHTCDGRKPVASLEQAGRQLVQAAYDQDLDAACRVATPYVGIELEPGMIDATRELLAKAGVTPQNVQVRVGEQMGSAYSVQLGSNEGEGQVAVTGHAVWDAGYTIGLPDQVYPDLPPAPEDPASQSASAAP